MTATMRRLPVCATGHVESSVCDAVLLVRSQGSVQLLISLFFSGMPSLQWAVPWPLSSRGTLRRSGRLRKAGRMAGLQRVTGRSFPGVSFSP